MNYLDAPKVKRTHCYGQLPSVYDISCPICEGTNITWSEFEKHIWCYDCNKDAYIDLYHSGIFSGPIPIGVAHVLGVRFDRINLETQEIIREEDPDYLEKFNTSFVYPDELSAYEKQCDLEERKTDEENNKEPSNSDK